MPAPLLPLRALNRTLLARQLLLERVAMTPAAALEHLLGLQAQNPGSPYQALRARLAGFDPMDLSGLLERREAVRMVLMRGTIHLVTAEDAARLRPVVQPVLDRELFANRAWARGVEGVDLEPVLALGRALTDERPRSMAELRAAIAERWPDLEAGSLAYAIRNRLPTVQATPRGLWGRVGGVALTTLERWTGRPMGEPASIDEVVVRYLRAFGPATVADASAWSRLTGLREPFEAEVSGVVVRQRDHVEAARTQGGRERRGGGELGALGQRHAGVREPFERLRPVLRTFRDERGRELFDVPDAPILTGDEPAPARLLPDYDNALLSHADRTRIVPPLPWPSLGDNVTAPALLVDGFVAGYWKPVGRGSATAIELHPLAAVTPAARLEVEAEAASLLAMLEPRADPGAIRWVEKG